MSSISKAATIADLRELARRFMPEFAFIPVDTGAGDGAGPLRNIEAFKKHLLQARVLSGVSDVDQRVTVFGQEYASPFGISAIGLAGNMRRGIDEDLAAAAQDAKIPFMLSGGSAATIEQITKIAPDVTWQQLYTARDPAITDDIVRRGRDAGAKVLVITVDAPLPPQNDWLARTGIKIPVGVPLTSWPYVAWQLLKHPRWGLEHARRGGLPKMESWSAYARPGAGTAEVSRIKLAQIPSVCTWAEVERIRKLWPGPLVLKGIVHPEDARRAADIGAEGITVSNHGGNMLDRAPAALDILRAMPPSARGANVCLFDGGIRRGSDIAVALANGADFCFVGRATLFGAIAGKKSGAVRAISILREELERTMVNIGCGSVTEIDPSFLAAPPEPG